MITNDTLSPRESVMMEKQEEENRLSRQHAVNMKRLEIEAAKANLKLKQEDAKLSRRHQLIMKELERDVRETEVRWTQIFRIPLTLIKLPVYCILAIGYIVNSIRNHEPPQDFWRLLH